MPEEYTEKYVDYREILGEKKENTEKYVDYREILGEKKEELSPREDEADKADIADKNEAEERDEEASGDNADAREVEIEKLKTELATARANFFNYRQRAERERLKYRKMITEDTIAEFLPVLDNLDRALSAPEDGSAKDILVGVRMVQRQFLTILENSEVTSIPTTGCIFDHQLHDAVETESVEDPDQDGAVLCELVRGYRTPDRVLRPAQVRVGRLIEN